MISYELLKNNAGILLKGDYNSLRMLHDVLHEVNSQSPLIKNKEGTFLGLAYDVRKAKEQQREIFPAPKHSPEMGSRFGVKILWPVILVQSRMLRASLAFMDSTKWQQTMAYNLDAVVESAIAEEFGERSAVERHWLRIDPSHPWAEEKLDSRGAIFCSWTKAERRKKTPGLIASLDSMYPSFYEHWVKNGEKDLFSPSELDSWAGSNWVDPKC